mmetsp:Transcript_21257/g.58940  ORF Transcript_21257/g.58940 Transcript_21257/m.58940 type:complete len:244 (-) Transcript_21257:231-962(-)
MAEEAHWHSTGPSLLHSSSFVILGHLQSQAHLSGFWSHWLWLSPLHSSAAGSAPPPPVSPPARLLLVVGVALVLVGVAVLVLVKVVDVVVVKVLRVHLAMSIKRPSHFFSLMCLQYAFGLFLYFPFSNFVKSGMASCFGSKYDCIISACHVNFAALWLSSPGLAGCRRPARACGWKRAWPCKALTSPRFWRSQATYTRSPLRSSRVFPLRASLALAKLHLEQSLLQGIRTEALACSRARIRST